MAVIGYKDTQGLTITSANEAQFSQAGKMTFLAFKEVDLTSENGYVHLSAQLNRITSCFRVNATDKDTTPREIIDEIERKVSEVHFNDVTIEEYLTSMHNSYDYLDKVENLTSIFA